MRYVCENFLFKCANYPNYKKNTRKTARKSIFYVCEISETIARSNVYYCELLDFCLSNEGKSDPRSVKNVIWCPRKRNVRTLREAVLTKTS